ncbi:MAG: hypothetical protein VYA01_04865, partial [Bacteroidota bacterium]|nr:hypothetical protein [Bacteroidota bacterium]
MIYVSNTNRKLTEKYVDWAVQGLPGATKMQPVDILKKNDCTMGVIFGVRRGTLVVDTWGQGNQGDF